MTRLIDLPVELLQEIGNARTKNDQDWDSYVDADDEKVARLILRHHDLLSLTFTCRAFYKIFNRLLYTFAAKRRYPDLFFKVAATGNLVALKQAVSFKLEPMPYFDGEEAPWAGLLSTASTFNQKDVATWLLDRGTPFEEKYWKDPDSRIDLKVCYPLISAMQECNEDIAILLLSRGANPQCKTERGTSRSLLHYAAGGNMIRLLEYLVREMGLPIDMPDYKGFTPLRYTMKYSKTPDTDTAMINKLIELGADVSSEVYGELPLTSAIARGKYRHATILLEAGSKAKPDRPFRKVKSPFQALIWSTKIISTETKRRRSVFSFRSRGGRRLPGPFGPPSIFKIEAQKTVFQKLVDAGIDLFERTRQGHTPLEEAFLYGSGTFASYVFHLYQEKYEEAVDVMSLLGFVVQNRMETRYQQMKNFAEKVDILLENGARIDIPLPNGQTYLQWLIDFNDGFKLECLGKLLSLVSKSMDKSMLDQKYLNRVLLEAYKSIPEDGDYVTVVDFLEKLIPYGAVVEDPADMHRITLGSISSNDLPDSLIPMFNSGIPDEKLSGFLVEALEKESPKWINYLLDRIEPNFDASRRNPQWIHKAVQYGEISIIRRLLEGVSSLDINHRAEDGITPIVRAIRLPWTNALCKVLLEYGADPFLDAKHPVCASISSRDFSNIHHHVIHEAQGVSAFEMLLHDQPWNVREFWYANAAKDRPDPKLFIPCVDCTWQSPWRESRGMIEWMKMASVEEYFSSWVELLAEIDTEDGRECTE
ncbi:ankyrin [Daldinia bambusicola]|nr:ankyrin [Daldinia bambusicola]